MTKPHLAFFLFPTACALLLTVGCGGDAVGDPAGTGGMGGTGGAGGIGTVSATLADCSGTFDTNTVEVVTEFEIDGDLALMRGLIDGTMPDRIDALVRDHPDVTTIAFLYAPGSINDDANVVAGRALRAAALSTCVVDNGVIASGAVDLFLAGAKRSLGANTFVGVHSWADGSGVEGGDLPRDDPAHDLLLDYYADIGIDEGFYWFTLDAAPSDSIHNMTEQERTLWGIATE